MANAIPEGYTSVTPYLAVNGASEMIDWLGKVFDATVTERIDGPNGAIMHSELKIGNSMLMLADASDKCPATTVALYVYVPDVDATYKRGLDAGATSESEPTDQFYGDRSGGLIDKWGNRWWVATHVKDVSPDEIQRLSAEWKDKQAQSAQ